MSKGQRSKGNRRQQSNKTGHVRARMADQKFQQAMRRLSKAGINEVRKDDE